MTPMTHLPKPIYPCNPSNACNPSTHAIMLTPQATGLLCSGGGSQGKQAGPRPNKGTGADLLHCRLRSGDCGIRAALRRTGPAIPHSAMVRAALHLGLFEQPAGPPGPET